MMLNRSLTPLPFFFCGISLACAQTDARPVASQASSPRYIIECEPSGPCDGTWTIDGTRGTAEWMRNTPVHATLQVESFSPDDIRITRTDNADSLSHYSGTLNDGTISGMVHYFYNGKEVGGGPWHGTIAHTSCAAPRGEGPTPEKAKEIADTAFRFKVRRDAFDCYLIAARAGNPEAQDKVGGYYFRGKVPGIPKNDEQSFYWFSKAGAQGDYLAERVLASMYRDGTDAVAPDPTKSDYWTALAEANPVAVQAAAQRAAADDQKQLLLGLILGAMGGSSGDSGHTEEVCTNNYRQINGYIAPVHCERVPVD